MHNWTITGQGLKTQTTKINQTAFPFCLMIFPIERKIPQPPLCQSLPRGEGKQSEPTIRETELWERIFLFSKYQWYDDRNYHPQQNREKGYYFTFLPLHNVHKTLNRFFGCLSVPNRMIFWKITNRKQI